MDEDIKFLEYHGYNIVDRKNILCYTLILISFFDEEEQRDLYEVAITSFHRPFSDPDFQNKEKCLENQPFKYYRTLINHIKDWIGQYGELCIGSMNAEKTTKYLKILKKEFNVSEIIHEEFHSYFRITNKI